LTPKSWEGKPLQKERQYLNERFLYTKESATDWYNL